MRKVKILNSGLRLSQQQKEIVNYSSNHPSKKLED